MFELSFSRSPSPCLELLISGLLKGPFYLSPSQRLLPGLSGLAAGSRLLGWGRWWLMTVLVFGCPDLL